jgi:hypothetical protein
MGFWSGAIKNMTHAPDRPLNGLTTSSRCRCLCRLCYKRRHTRQRVQTTGRLAITKAAVPIIMSLTKDACSEAPPRVLIDDAEEQY